MRLDIVVEIADEMNASVRCSGGLRKRPTELRERPPCEMRCYKTRLRLRHSRSKPSGKSITVDAILYKFLQLLETRCLRCKASNVR